ncbi:MAG: ABC transporter permease [Anaerolineae bacterium]|jgi:putative ABC transport system permease protein|nr:FtsX-like permease family protein [Chloroflexota bacterium]
MGILESLRISLQSIGANKMRSLLTMLGIVIGTGAVIALMSAGAGAQAAISSELHGIGSNVLMLYPNFTTINSTGDVKQLTLADAQAIADPAQVPHVSAVAPTVDGSVTGTYGSEVLGFQLQGATEELAMVRNHRVAYGRFISAGDDAVSARVVVLGAQVADRLIGDRESAVGETIRLNGIPFKVIGVLQAKGGSMFGMSEDQFAIVPLSTAYTKLFPWRVQAYGGRTVDLIYASVVDAESVDTAVAELQQVMRQRQGTYLPEDDRFTVTSQQDVLGAFDQVMGIMTTFLAAIASISLLVGGIGIMNIMLVSVTERTREIGLRKALGATRAAILSQFLIESIVLSVIGGLTGVGLGWAIGMIINQMGAFRTLVTPQSVLLAVSFSLLVGLFFGIYPALRAARLNPIDALRYE